MALTVVMNIDRLLTQLTIDEKIAMLTGSDTWSTVPVKRLSIPSVVVSDGPHGLRKVKEERPGQDALQYPAVCFPTYSALAATWNDELAQQMGAAIAGDCIDNKVDVLLGPGVNMKRNPLCGRNFEYLSEDPYLAGRLGTALVNGVQSRGIGTSLKHFAGNSQEVDRFWVNSEIDERALREIYLPAFEKIVKEAKPWTVMCAYNLLNGVHCSQNRRLLFNILRKEWGFDGIVVSDWGAVHDRVESLKASLELEMPYCKTSFESLKKAYEEDRINEYDIDFAVEGILRLVKKVSEAADLRDKVKDTTDDRYNVSKQVADEAVTLLKNEDEILPISKKIKKLAVFGLAAADPTIQGGGSAGVTPIRKSAPLDYIRKLAGDDIEVVYAPCYNQMTLTSILEIQNLPAALNLAYEADMSLIFVSDTIRTELEGFDRNSIRLQPELEKMILQLTAVNPNTVVVVQAGSVIDMSEWFYKVKGVVYSWYLGGAGGESVADVLFGKVNPSGKTAETFPLCLEDTPAFDGIDSISLCDTDNDGSFGQGAYPCAYPGNGKVSWYREGMFIGYRFYDTWKKEVLIPFGFGLSYTQFEYSKLKIVQDENTARVECKIKNTGKCKGRETVQIYVRPVQPYVLRPEKELKGYVKVELEPNEQKTIKVELDERAFSYYSMNDFDWKVDKGYYEILVGSSSRDIKLTGKIKM